MGKTTDPKIMQFVKKVGRKYKLDKAIFFGSRARGDHLKNSDYDILLVSPDYEGIFFTQRIAEMYQFWKYYPLEIEPLCYTPEEFSRKSKRLGIVQQAVKEGIEIPI